MQMVVKKPEYFLTWRSRLMPSRMHQPHRAGIVIGPDRSRRRDRASAFRNASAARSSASSQAIGSNCARALRPVAAQRLRQPVGMMDALGIARDLGADHAGGVGIVFGPRTRPIRAPSSTSTSSAQVDGQSCGQADATDFKRGGDGRACSPVQHAIRFMQTQCLCGNSSGPGGSMISGCSSIFLCWYCRSQNPVPTTNTAPAAAAQ